jgi:hypothetical protein
MVGRIRVLWAPVAACALSVMGCGGSYGEIFGDGDDGGGTRDAGNPGSADDATVGGADACTLATCGVGVEPDGGVSDASEDSSAEDSSAEDSSAEDSSIDSSAAEDGAIDGDQPDASPDTGSPHDAAADTGSEHDASPDAATEPDASPDAGSQHDASPDAATEPDASPDAGSEHDASPDAAPDAGTGPAVATYSCKVVVLGMNEGTFDLTMTFDGDTPSSAAASSSISMTEFQVTAVLSGATVNAIMADGVKSFSGSATTVDVVATNSTSASTSTVNAVPTAGASFTIPSITLVANEPVTVRLPTATATIGTWTAVPSGPSTMSFTTGDIDLDLTFNVGFSVSGTMTCTPPSPAPTISTTNVP